MAQVVEKPADAKKTIGRLLKYFGKAKRLMLGLVVAVICVTLVALAAPSLQGEAIDLIKEHQWDELLTCVKLLMCAYLANILFGLAQSLGSLVSGVLTIIGTVSIMFMYCWQLTLITMISVIITVFVTKKV